MKKKTKKETAIPIHYFKCDFILIFYYKANKGAPLTQKKMMKHDWKSSHFLTDKSSFSIVNACRIVQCNRRTKGTILCFVQNIWNEKKFIPKIDLIGDGDVDVLLLLIRSRLPNRPLWRSFVPFHTVCLINNSRLIEIVK